MNEFSQILKQLRANKKLSRAKLAQGIGYGVSIIYYWENAEKEPNLNAIKKIACYFDVSADYLLGLTDDPTPNWTSDTTR